MSPTDKIPVTLEAQAWDAVIRIMAKSPVPYDFVAPLLQDIQGQCTRQHAEPNIKAATEA